MKMPKVSVLMPVYKTNEKYLREAIESILTQTFSDFEFLILDDYPEDSRETIVKSYADKRIKYIKNEQNMGITPSRNKLIKMAKGEYLAVMDHDDISLPDRFEKEVAYLDEHPEVGVVSCFHKRIVSHQQLIYPIENDDIIRSIVKGACCVLHPASMIRKQILIENNVCYEEEYSPCEDFMLWARLIEYTKFHNIPEFLFLYRDHEENTSHIQSKKMEIATKEIIEFMANKYPLLTGKYTKYFPCKKLPIIKIKTNENTKKFYFLNIQIFKIKKIIKGGLTCIL